MKLPVKFTQTALIPFLALCSLPLHAQISPEGNAKKPAISTSEATFEDGTPTAKTGSPAEAARKAFEEGSHMEAVELALPLAEKGDPEAIYLLGFAYETGRGAEKSLKTAEKYYRQG